MYKFVNFLILNKKFTTEKIFIRNKAVPICSNCVHFIEHINNYPIHINEKYGICKNKVKNLLKDFLK